ncbi:glutathione S-transferase family protein [Prosthecomicrobium pneumaticum]|uniref:Glutathione S-transferase n=1 Tax=Prosthecomicrobium pneumaticum TaxID=81895 RepID=A0A7W9FKZ9_9HYPH|nr:glutathione S-transferase family protein [Prosthecomicrobium pneumaticum]MBB5751814.1 glutathione S-transferase [Prosthecomicrobium pneumaticum]
MPLLYHHPFSAASRFVRLILGEYDEEVELVETMPWKRDEKLLLVNPAGTLPVFVDHDGVTASGALVIAEYLAETRGARMGEVKLLPENVGDRAEARRLLHWFAVKMHGEVTDYLATEKIFKRLMTIAEGGGSPNAAAIRAARANIRYHLQYIGWLAARRNWLGGRGLSFADLAAAAELSVVDYLGEVPWEADETAKAWYARIKSRPSFRPILAETMRGLPAATHYADLDF